LLARLGTASLAVLVTVAVLIQLLLPGYGFVAVVSGLCLVLGGTVITARLSHSESAIRALIKALQALRQPQVGQTALKPT